MKRIDRGGASSSATQRSLQSPQGRRVRLLKDQDESWTNTEDSGLRETARYPRKGDIGTVLTPWYTSRYTRLEVVRIKWDSLDIKAHWEKERRVIEFIDEPSKTPLKPPQTARIRSNASVVSPCYSINTPTKGTKRHRADDGARSSARQRLYFPEVHPEFGDVGAYGEHGTQMEFNPYPEESYANVYRRKKDLWHGVSENGTKGIFALKWKLS
mmetsp:Transcript_28750/g.39196  ORF Transcript_28750/g.39196 Transcript_28750/m.39196 type:complete len:213 (-) Transcript_28750:599-1237(-)